MIGVLKLLMRIVIEPKYENHTIESVLKTELGFARGLIRKLKQIGTVRLNEIPGCIKLRVKAGDVLEISMDEERSNIEPQNIPLNIVFEDKDLLVADKPPGMLVHPLSTEPCGTLANAVMYHWLQTGSKSVVFRPLYRLDRQTSGLVVISKNIFTYPGLVRQLQNKTLGRTYIAIVDGYMGKPAGTIDLPIRRKPGSIIKREVGVGGKPAVTHFSVINRLEIINASLLKVILETGRTHQIRAHFSYAGHPLLGDTLYGGATNLIGRQALHACSVNFLHPRSRVEMVLQSPLPGDILKLLKLADYDYQSLCRDNYGSREYEAADSQILPAIKA